MRRTAALTCCPSVTSTRSSLLKRAVGFLLSISTSTLAPASFLMYPLSSSTLIKTMLNLP